MLIYLKRLGKNVRCLVRETSSMKQLERVCDFYRESFPELRDSVEWVYGDTLDFVGLLEQMRDVHDVYHCAAVVSFNSKDKNSTLRTNICGTANMVDAALKNGVQRFCFISSIAALGKTSDNTPINEETPRKNDEPHSVYAESKCKSELEVWRGIAEGLNAVILNPGIILGPGLLDKGSMLLFKTGMKGIPFYTKGVTGYVDVRDVCRGAVELLESDVFGQRFIFVSENTSNKVLFERIAQAFGKRPPRIEATRSLLTVARMLSDVFNFFMGKTGQLTKETVRSALHSECYSTAKLQKYTDFRFTPFTQTIDDICSFIKGTNAAKNS